MGQVCPVKQEEEAHGKHRWGAAGTWLAAGTRVAAGTWLAAGTPGLGGQRLSEDFGCCYRRWSCNSGQQCPAEFLQTLHKNH